MTDFTHPIRHLKPKFPLGRIVVTLNALATLETADVNSALSRHAGCDWGEIPDDDRDTNDSAIWGGGMLMSEYRARHGVKFWIITETDRRSTTVLMPEDY